MRNSKPIIGNFSIFFLFFCFINFVTTAQERGNLFMKNYLPKEYNGHTQNWWMTQDDNGLIYIANTTGVLEYDGENWRKIELPQKTTVRAVAKGADGLIYVGSQSDFGYLSPDTLGTLQYKSLLNEIPKKHIGFKDVWSVHAVGERIFFMTDHKLFGYNTVDKSFKVWQATEERGYFLTYEVLNELYITELGKGLMKLVDDDFQMVEEGEKFSELSIYDMCPIKSDGSKMLIATTSQGLYVYDDTEYPVIKRLESPLNDELQEKSVRDISRTAEGYVLATRRGGIYVIDQSFNLVQRISQKDGLPIDQVWFAGIDKQGAIWACLNKGLSRIEINTPFTYWAENEGLGKVFDILKHQGSTYVASNQNFKILNAKNNKFEDIESNLGTGQVWDLYLYQYGNKEVLLGCAQGGLLEINGKQGKKIDGIGKTVFKIYSPKKYPEILLAATSDSLFLLEYKANKLQVRGAIAGYNHETRYIEEDEDGMLWLATLYKGIYSFSLSDNPDEWLNPSINAYDTLHGLPKLGNNAIRNVKGKLIFTTAKGLLEFNKTQNKFVESNIFGEVSSLKGLEDIGLLGLDKKQKLWFRTESTTGSFDFETNLIDTMFFKRLPQMELNAFYPDADGTSIWVGGSEGLYKYDNTSMQLLPSFETLIRNIYVNSDSLIFGGASAKTNSSKSFEFPYSVANQSILIQFATPSFDYEEANRYSYKLEKQESGFFAEKNNPWSHWSAKSEKEYTNLREGTYTFKVKSENVYGIESGESNFQFTILSPWYRSWWAYIIYSVFALILVWLLVRLNTARLEKANKKLEGIVTERTTEVTEKNQLLTQKTEEILTQNEELQQQQEEIITQRDYIEGQNEQLKDQNTKLTDSIRYAKTIQEGLLPFEDRLSNNLKDYFVLFRPKDIVSGDFYWFEKVGNKKFLAVGDCTGHGVPGAFMSVIGIAILSDIVLKYNITSPSQILTELNKMIRKVLKQDQESSNQDGMDIGICVWEDLDEEQVKLSFSGAHRPLYLFQNEELQEIKGVNRSVGGNHLVEREYQTEKLIIEKSAKIYLTTDGFADQNGIDGRKVGSLKLKDMLAENSHLDFKNQSESLHAYLNNYQGDLEQRDDITILGFQV